MAELNWTEAQWQKVNGAVTEAFGKVSVASAFLPCYGPLPGSAETVRNERLKEDHTSTPTTLRLDGDHDAVNLKLVNLTVNVLLSSEQVADESLSNALLAFRRAGSILAQEEDQIVFGGLGVGPQADDSKFVANRIELQRGLADLDASRRFPELAGGVPVNQAVVSAVVKSIHRLEDNFHPGPFACVLGNELFDAVHDPSPALVLPADRITPLLKGGPLLRSGKMKVYTGIVVSLADNAVDIVVGTPPTAQFLQRTADAKFLFRVYERFALRMRDAAPPVAGFRMPTTRAQRNAEQQKLNLGAAERDLAKAQQERDNLPMN